MARDGYRGPTRAEKWEKRGRQTDARKPKRREKIIFGGSEKKARERKDYLGGKKLFGRDRKKGRGRKKFWRQQEHNPQKDYLRTVETKKCVLLITSLSSFYSSGVEGAATLGFFEPFISGIRSECKDKKYMMTDKSQSDKKKFRGVRGETPRKIKEFLSLFTLRPDYRDGSS